MSMDSPLFDETPAIEDRFGSPIRLVTSDLGLWLVTDGEDGHSDPLALLDRVTVEKLVDKLGAWLESTPGQR